MLLMQTFLLILVLLDARSAFEAGTLALAGGDLASAEHSFQQVLKAEPRNIGALGNLGVVYSRMNRTSDAIAVYHRALKVAEDPMLMMNLGLAYLKQDDYGAAKPLFSRIAERQPGNKQARELLATTQIFTGETSKGVQALESFERNSGTLYFLSIGYLKLGRREDAKRSIGELFTTVTPAQANLLAGRAYYESAMFEPAAEALEKALSLDASLPGLHRELGKVYVSLRRAEDAVRELTEAVRRSPEDEESNYFLGALLLQQGEIENGISRLEKARLARPDFWGCYYYLGRAHLQNSDAREAIPLLQRAASLHPEEPAVYYQLARALKSAGRDSEAAVASEKAARYRTKTAKAEQEALVAK